MRQLNLGLVYHFNQNTVPNAFAADRVCYRPLLEIFLAHPRIGFTIHFSGALLSALQWEGRETINLLKKGIARGQFEIIGSAYAQNILLATDPWENVQQLKHHRQQLKEVLQVEPTGFWNPERCWQEELAPLILDAGYEYTFLETNVFRRGGDQLPQAVIRAVQAGDRQLVLFPDDTNFLTVFGKAVRTGSVDELVEYLYNIYLAQGQMPEHDFAVIYAQDAEATGLWQFEGGSQTLDDVFAKLDAVLAKLESLPWLKVGGLSELARTCRPVVVDCLPAGQANWMMDSLRSQGLPWGEQGYKDWFDYAENAAKNIETRELYHQVSSRLRKHEEALLQYDQKAPEYTASKRLFDLAVRTLVAHQYEFGCIGIDVDKEAQWQLARSALPVLWASELALQGKTRQAVEMDVNADGLQELVVVHGANAYVFAPKGGRLLSWFNLERGCQLVGNQNAMCYLERYRDDHSYVPDMVGGRDAFPQLRGKPEVEDLSARRFVMRRRCLNDAVSVGNSEPVRFYDFPFQHAVSEGEDLVVTFNYAGRLFGLEKQITFTAGGFDVAYILHRYPVQGSVRIAVENELTPDYFTIMDRGAQIVTVEASPEKAVLRNQVTHCGLEIAGRALDHGEVSLSTEAGFLAWLCRAEFAGAPRGGEPIKWALSFRLE